MLSEINQLRKCSQILANFAICDEEERSEQRLENTDV